MTAKAEGPIAGSCDTPPHPGNGVSAVLDHRASLGHSSDNTTSTSFAPRCCSGTGITRRRLPSDGSTPGYGYFAPRVPSSGSAADVQRADALMLVSVDAPQVQ